VVSGDLSHVPAPADGRLAHRDLAVRRGFGLAWNIPTPTPKQLDLLGEPYRPYRSVVAWYCWRAAQLYAGTVRTPVTS
jgi:DNA-3-methyladenine glycosylase II